MVYLAQHPIFNSGISRCFKVCTYVCCTRSTSTQLALIHVIADQEWHVEVSASVRIQTENLMQVIRGGGGVTRGGWWVCCGGREFFGLKIAHSGLGGEENCSPGAEAND